MLRAAVGSGSAEQDPAKQIEALQKIKRSLSPGERKLDGKLAVKLRQKQLGGRPRSTSRCAQPDDDLVARLQKAGATVRHVASTGEIRAAVPASALRTVATWGAVERIEPAAQAMTARYGGRTLSKEERGEIITALRPRRRRASAPTPRTPRARPRRSPASGRSCAR